MPLSKYAVHRLWWDRPAGCAYYVVYYGPYGPSSSTWIVPGTINEDLEPEPERGFNDDEEWLGGDYDDYGY